MWNAVEAHNMYRNLIQVFAATGDKFVYKATALAWRKFSFALHMSGILFKEKIVPKPANFKTLNKTLSIFVSVNISWRPLDIFYVNTVYSFYKHNQTDAMFCIVNNIFSM